MDGRRRQRSDYYRRSRNRKPPRGYWQPTVPSWEKEFCRVIGALDWETLLQMKKFTHLYDNVMNWNDSAGEEAFRDAKKRYWAEINGFSCDIPLPDPDLYIDKINWDSESDAASLPDPEFIPDEDHVPVVIFGDSLMPNEAFLATGWGDEEEKLEVQNNHANNHSSANYGATWEQDFPYAYDWGWSYTNNNHHFGECGTGYQGNERW